jgi:hypothetical protein
MSKASLLFERENEGFDALLDALPVFQEHAAIIEFKNGVQLRKDCCMPAMWNDDGFRSAFFAFYFFCIAEDEKGTFFWRFPGKVYFV